jgi:hypothetical protein
MQRLFYQACYDLDAFRLTIREKRQTPSAAGDPPPLESLETALTSQGFHLDNSLIGKLKRALAYFSESVQRSNVAANEPDIKSQQAFMKVYESHLHGDRDDTPVEWRDYK